MSLFPSLFEKVHSLTDRISHFSLLVEGFYTPLRGAYMAQSFPIYMDLKVEVNQVFKGPECLISGTVSAEHFVDGAELHGESRGGFPGTAPEINLYFNNTATGESCRLVVTPKLSSLIRWRTRELQLEGTLYCDGAVHAEATLTLPVEQLLRLFSCPQPARQAAQAS